MVENSNWVYFDFPKLNSASEVIDTRMERVDIVHIICMSWHTYSMAQGTTVEYAQ